MTLKYNIIETLCVLSECSNGWKKELNCVSWNDNLPKLDIRVWNSDHTKMDKGVTLTNEEAERLVMALCDYTKGVK